MHSLHGRVKWLFPAMLMAAVLQNFHDLSLLFSEGSLSLFRYDGPIIYKALKDILYVSVLAAILYRAQKTARSPLTGYSGALIALILFMVALSMLANGFVAGLIGLRWIFPFMLFLLMGDWSEVLDTAAAVPWIVLGLAGCLVVQVYQLFYMPPVFGEIFPGVPARTPGFFVAPNSTAFFACVSAACVMVFAPSKLKLRVLAVGLALMVSALAQSGTGIVTAVLLGLRLMCGRHRQVFWMATLCALALALPNLDFLTMREDYVELSGGGRLDAFLDIARDSAFSVARFGLYTNTANLQSANPEDQLAPDSLMASWAGNFGFFAVLAAVLSALFIRYRMRAVDWSGAMPCVLVFGIFSMTTIVFEAFPMNLYLALGIWSARRATLPAR
ncbi:MAG: hypothetical protein ACREXV_19675 [Polaromonas sp.]